MRLNLYPVKNILSCLLADFCGEGIAGHGGISGSPSRGILHRAQVPLEMIGGVGNITPCREGVIQVSGERLPVLCLLLQQQVRGRPLLRAHFALHLDQPRISRPFANGCLKSRHCLLKRRRCGGIIRIFGSSTGVIGKNLPSSRPDRLLRKRRRIAGPELSDVPRYDRGLIDDRFHHIFTRYLSPCLHGGTHK